MIQVNLFWSFAIGSSFAAFAGRLLQHEHPFYNQYFMYTIIFLSLIFSPSGIYLLWAFPGWESMHYFKSKEDIDPILPLVFSFTNIFSGVLGFLYSQSFIYQDDLLEAHSVWVRAYGIMMGVLGFGYSRFLYPGNDWSVDKNSSIGDFLSSDVFFALLAMSFVFLPLLSRPQLKWFWKNGNGFQDQAKIWSHITHVWISNLGIGTVCYSIFIFLVCDDQSRNYFRDGAFGYFAPLVGFLVAQMFFLFLISLFLLVPHSSKQKNQ